MEKRPEATRLGAQYQDQDFSPDRLRSEPTPESLREVALHCIESFGVDQSMFGSDFPVGRLWTSYDAIFDGFKAIVRDFSEGEQAALFHDNAQRVYRMDPL